MERVSGSVSPVYSISGAVNISGGDVPVYDGEYEVDPSTEEAVVLETEGYKLLQNVVVNQVQETITATDDGNGNVTLWGEITVIDNDGNISL